VLARAAGFPFAAHFAGIGVRGLFVDPIAKNLVMPFDSYDIRAILKQYLFK
jgi:hypothetical protein